MATVYFHHKTQPIKRRDTEKNIQVNTREERKNYTMYFFVVLAIIAVIASQMTTFLLFGAKGRVATQIDREIDSLDSDITIKNAELNNLANLDDLENFGAEYDLKKVSNIQVFKLKPQDNVAME